ncbi:conserved hypothetical protein [Candidatus Methylobacter favarea]|uniref:Uncharacterized protein n=1 Tax=Candidatus Methylobacter favarea TaxID=2707345 RepID=A0A8S0X288_9GAMM|nr:hypothetical protein [Candidatus Methylobacter favarea]CAA9891712.1 conserved hypothetical protein [Candidatus Methylobacter favarea]
MTKNLTILTTIVLTAATTAGGTYYLTTNGQASNNPENAPMAVTPQIENGQQVIRVATQDADKPITIIVKTEVKENRPKRDHIGHIRDLKQPEYGVFQGK